MPSTFEITVEITEKMRNSEMAIYFDPNKSLLNFQDKHVSDIQEFSDPIFQALGVSHFVHVRVDHLGGFRSLMTSTELTKYYHQMEYPIAFSSGKGVTLNNGFYVVSVEGGLSEIKNRSILKTDFNVEHLVYIVNRNVGFDDLYVFGSKQDNFISTFVNNMDIAKHFIHYFTYNTRKIMKDCPRLIYPQALLKGEAVISSMKNQADIFKEMPLKKIYLTVNESQVTVSAQEYSCLKYLVTSLTLKEIAIKMNLSPRTVETYFNSLKKKLRCESRQQLHEFMKSLYLI